VGQIAALLNEVLTCLRWCMWSVTVILVCLALRLAAETVGMMVRKRNGNAP